MLWSNNDIWDDKLNFNVKNKTFHDFSIKFLVDIYLKSMSACYKIFEIYTTYAKKIYIFYYINVLNPSKLFFINVENNNNYK